MCGRFMGPFHLGLKSLVHSYKVTSDVVDLDTQFRMRRIRVSAKESCINPGTWVLCGLVTQTNTSWQSPNSVAWCGPSLGPNGVRTMLIRDHIRKFGNSFAPKTGGNFT